MYQLFSSRPTFNLKVSHIIVATKLNEYRTGWLLQVYEVDLGLTTLTMGTFEKNNTTLDLEKHLIDLEQVKIVVVC